MEDKKLKTESLDSRYEFIDRLSDSNAIDYMLLNQQKSLDILNKNKKDIQHVVVRISSKLEENPSSRIIYVGAGTSGRIGVQDGVELIPTFGWSKKRLVCLMAGGDKALLESVENAEDNENAAKIAVKKNMISNIDVVIGLSASGGTPYTNMVLKEARKNGALTIGISNNKKSLLIKNSEINITLETGSEVIAGSTRLTAGTAQKICLNTISTLVMVKLGNVVDGQMINMIPLNDKLRKRASKILQNRSLNK